MNNLPSLSEISRHYACTVLVTTSGRLIGQHRDDKPGIDNPGQTSGFGGVAEGNETPRQAAWRELVQEETNLTLYPDDLIAFHVNTNWRRLTGEWEMQHWFAATIDDTELETLKVYEGQGWREITGPDDPNIIGEMRGAISAYQACFARSEPSS